MSESTLLTLPVVCTRGMIVFPGNRLSLDVGRPLSLKALELSSRDFDNNILFVSQINPIVDDPKYDDVYHVGTLCKIEKKIRRDSAGTIKLTVTGEKRVALRDFKIEDGSIFSTAEVLEDIYGDTNEEVALVRKTTAYFEQARRHMPHIPAESLTLLSNGTSASLLADTIGQYLPIDLDRKQKILEEQRINERLFLVASSIESEKMISQLEDTINRKVKESIDENQKEYYLREKLRAIKDELGDTVDKGDDADQIRKELAENPYPQYIKDKIEEELRRFEAMPPASSEANVVRTYIDWVMKTPWYQETKDEEDISKIEAILEEDHFGLEKVKERIVEHLAVKQMTQSLKAPIICLAGPPGVGKTSIAKSIARALDRKFVKASLGGVRDEAEVRGHRRTYLGSMPGRIIQGMKKAGVVNPVFLLDEIDKDRIKEENILSYLNECMGIRIDFDRLDKIIYFLLENELSNADYQSEVIIKIVEALDFSEYNLRQTRFYEMIKKIKRLVDEKTIEEDRMQMDLILEEIQEKFISINLCGIVDLLKIIYGDLNQKEFENVRRISQLLVVIKKINEVADNKIKIHQVNKDVENIANYFCNLEKEFCKEDFLEIKEECLYFLQPIKNMFKILELLYKEAEEVYNIGLEKVNIRNVQSIIQKVERRERKQLANDEKDLFAEEFMQLAYEIKQKLHIYTEDEKKKMLRMLNETYNKLDKETNIRKRAEKEWRWLRIDLFKLGVSQSLCKPSN